MKAAFLQSPGHIHLQDINLPQPGSGEVRVRLKQIGICGSDVHLFLGHRRLDKPTIIGHEGLGHIDQIGPGVTGRSVGERVVIEPNIPCRQCRYCMEGRGNICINKRVVGQTEPGAFAEFVILPAAFCWPVPDSVSDADAVTAEPMAVAVHALLTSRAKPGDTIAVIGLGAIGLLLTHLATRLGYRVLVTERQPTKIRLAEGMGAVAHYPTGTLDEQADALAQAWLREDVCAVFECAGAATTASLATAAAPRGAELVLVGLAEKPASFTPLKIAREGISIIPSLIYDHPTDFRRTIRLIEAGVIQPGQIISRSMPLDELQQALELAAEGTESKIIIQI